MKNKLPQKYYIGLSVNFHDPSVALVNENGEIVFAQATERFLQNKMAISSTSDTYFYADKILDEYPMNDYEISFNWTQFESLFKYIFVAGTVYAMRNYNKLIKWFGKRLGVDGDEFSAYMNYHQSSYFSARSNTGAAFRFVLNQRFNLPFKYLNKFDHHLCHTYHSFYTSSFKEATILVIDGGGDKGKSCSVYTAKGQNIVKVFRNKSWTSLGFYYGSLTYLCDFNPNGGEDWKVMGMAPYGKFHEELYNDLKEWIHISDISLETKNSKQFFIIRKKIRENHYQNLTREDIAYTGQLYYEEMVMQLINNMHKKWPNENLVITGGCGLNSAFNGKVHTGSPYKNVFIPSAPADDGCSVGSALLNFKKFNPGKEIPHNQSNPYLGFDVKEEDILFMAKFSGYEHEKMSYEKIYTVIAKEIESGKIIGWVQGRAEFGPRALGNRSILANPSLAGMKDKINSRVKFREEFRPFAPAILEEKASEYFENYHPTPYMERVLKIKEDKRDLLKAVNHIDNTGRLQTVSKKSNEHFYNLINEFYKLTDVPVLLNTSFNVMGKPIVNSVNDMAAVFATSGIDILVINDHVFKKNTNSN